MLITARENPLIKEAAALVSDKKARQESGLFVVEGARLCFEAYKSGAKILRLFVTEAAQKKYEDFVNPLYSCAKEVYNISEGVASKISDTKTPQGVFALCKKEEKEIDLSQEGLFVLLSELQDPGNIGTILRTCEAMDAKGVFLCSCADLYSPKVLRSTMGCIFRLPVSTGLSTEEALEVLSTAGVTTYAAALDGRAQMLPEVKFARKSCVLIGNEGNGLRKEVVENCSSTVMIPMPGKAESLNAASAAAILIYTASVNR